MKKYQSIRIFKNPFLESLTHVHPVIPLLMWVPIILFLFQRNFEQYDLSLFEYGLTFVFGVLLWTLSEYLLHRFVFHFETENKFGKRIVFLFHGLHHDDPHDPTRLVMPPAPALIISSFLYFLMWIVFPGRYLDALFASFMVGYLCYDYIHYGTHHFAMKNGIARFLKIYHLKHHFSHEPCSYGVSSPLWDHVFKTLPKKDSSVLTSSSNA